MEQPKQEAQAEVKQPDAKQPEIKTDPVIVNVSNLKKDFIKGQVKALRGLSFEVKDGEFVIIYGPSGCGKTTLLGLIAGLEPPTSGQVTIGGRNINQLRRDEKACLRRHTTGMVFQQYNLVSSLSALDNVAMPLILSGVKRSVAIQESSTVLDKLGLESRKKHKPSQLSGGEQQRVAIARALVTKPKILLVDEPTGNLDQENSRQVLETLERVNGWGTTIVMVTHNPDYIKIAHRVMQMSDGTITRQVTNKRFAPRPQTKEEVETEKTLAYKLRGNMGRIETLRLALTHLRNKKARSIFTILGVALGVGSIVGLVSLGIGLQRITEGQIASFNSLVTVEVTQNENSRNPLNDEAVEKLKAIKNVELVSPSVTMAAKLNVEDTSTEVMLIGLNPEAHKFENVSYSKGDGKDLVMTAAAGQNFGDKSDEKLIGKSAKLDAVSLPEEESANATEMLANTQAISYDGTITGMTDDSLVAAVYMPLEKMKKGMKFENYSSVKVKVKNRRNIQDVRNEIDKLGYSTKSVTDLVQKIEKVFLVTQTLLGLIGSIALLVALLGIVNIMTISLLERTHEVGIMKAIGATDKEIGRLFHSEAGLFGFFGGIIGVALAYLIEWLINAVLNLVAGSASDQPLDVFVTPWVFGLVMVVVSYFVSRLAGWYPSRRAAKLSAMEALRYE